MAILNFPSNPSVDETYEENGVLYVWDGTKWTANTSANFLPITGGELTGDLTVPSLNGGPLAGFRNQIINGDFRVKQYFNNGTGSNKYITDRWVTNDSTFGATASVSDVKGASRGLKLEGGSRIIRQLVELPLDNSGDASPGQFYNGSQWTFSIYADVAPEQLTAGFVDTGTGVANLQSVTGMPAWTATSDVQGAYTRYTCTFTVNTAPVASNRAFRVSWSFASTATFTLAQLEPGPVATPFEQRPMGTELALCQMYYQTLPFLRVPVAGINSALPAYRQLVVPRTVTMRADPDETYGSTTTFINISLSGRAEIISVSGEASPGNAQSCGFNDYTADAEL